MASNSLSLSFMTLFIFALIFSPTLPSEAATSLSPAPAPALPPRPRFPICPRCVCCAPPPAPGKCCPCFCPRPPPPAEPPTTI